MLLENQLLILRPAHFDRSCASAVVTPMTFATVEALAYSAIIAHENVGRLFLISGMNRHG
jgi:hypothetical protein